MDTTSALKKILNWKFLYRTIKGTACAALIVSIIIPMQMKWSNVTSSEFFSAMAFIFAVFLLAFIGSLLPLLLCCLLLHGWCEVQGKYRLKDYLLRTPVIILGYYMLGMAVQDRGVWFFLFGPPRFLVASYDGHPWTFDNIQLNMELLTALFICGFVAAAIFWRVVVKGRGESRAGTQ